MSFEALHDWDVITAHIAAENHWFDGRKVACYHPVTYGFLIGELIRRVDGRRPGTFFREEVAQKVGADFQIGRSIARICAILALRGEHDGVRYLSQRMVDEAATVQACTEDRVLGWIKYGLGFGLHSSEFPAPTPTAFHWGGYGGSFGMMDPPTGISCGYAPNNLHLDGSPFADPRLRRLWDVLGGRARYAGLKRPDHVGPGVRAVVAAQRQQRFLPALEHAL